MSLTPVNALDSVDRSEAIARRWYELFVALGDEDNYVYTAPWPELPLSYRRLIQDVVVHLIAEGTIR